MPFDNSSKDHPQPAASRGTADESPSTESASVLPHPPAQSAAAAAQTDAAYDDDEAKDAPLPPAHIAAAYGEMDAAMKEATTIPTSDIDVPLPPAQFGAAYDDMDAAMKLSAERVQAVDDVPLPPSQIASAHDEEMGGGEMDMKKRAEPKTRDDVAADTSPRHRDDSNIRQDKPSSAILPSSSPPPISQGQISSDTGNIRGREQVFIRPPHQSTISPTNDDVNTPSVPVRTLPSQQPSVPVLEATLVPEIPIYDAVQIPDEVPVAQEDEEEQQTWLKRNKKYITFGGIGLLLGLGVAVAVGLSFSSNNPGPNGNESDESEAIVPPSTVPPSESFSPSRVPSLRPTLPPSQSANPSHPPSSSRGPSLLPSTSTAPTPRLTCGEVHILTDQYSDETTWSLSRNVTTDGASNLEVILEGAPKFAGKHTREVCLEKGEYQFAIFDSEGNGICCKYGEGRYTVTMEGVVIAQGGEFESVEIASFSLPVPTPQPSRSPSPSGIPSLSLRPSRVRSSPPSTYWSTLNWNQQGQNINGEEPGDGLGQAVALSADGLTMAIGAPVYWSWRLLDTSKNGPGYVKVFCREGEGSSWEQRGDTMYGRTDGDGFGLSLSLSDDGETLLVGAPRIDPQERGSVGYGQVAVYKWDQAVLNYKPIGDILYGEAPAYEFGRAVDLSSDGKTLAVGASGQVKVYVWDEVDNNYKQQGEAISGDSTDNLLGSSLTLSGDGEKLASGATGYTGGGKSGQVHIFAWDEASLNFKQLGGPIVSEADESFGFSISISDDGDRLAIGAPYIKNADGEEVGQVKIFAWDEAASTFKQLGQSLDGKGRVFFGESISLSSDGKSLAIGARAGGYVEVYRWDDAALIYKQLSDRIEGVGSIEFGGSVALSANGTVLAVGADSNNENGLQSGQVKVFKIE